MLQIHVSIEVLTAHYWNECFWALYVSLPDCNGWTDVERFGNADIDWHQKYLSFEQGVPSHGTLGQVSSRLNPVHFYACLKSFGNKVTGQTAERTGVIDDKPLRRSHVKASGLLALMSVL